LEREPRNAPIWLKLFVAFHVIAITSWSLPKSAPGVLNGAAEPVGLDWLPYYNDKYVRVSPAQQYILALGLWQSWDMFAPNPTHKDVWCDAVIKHRSGRESVYRYPRVYDQGYFGKYAKERYRKYYERAHLNMYSWMWEPFAQHIARLSNSDPGDPPVEVLLRRHIILIPRPVTAREYFEGLKEGKWLSDAPPVPDFEVQPYFSYKVKEQDLR
jgi:hypothetical protein